MKIGWSVLVVIASFAGTAGAQQAPRLIIEGDDPETAYINPYVDVSRAYPVDIPNLSKSVIFLFSPECSASRSIHRETVQWGSTLPDGWRFIPLPVMGPGATAPGFVAFGARKAAAGGGMTFSEGLYWDLLYHEVQQNMLSMEDLRRTVAIAVEAGADEKAVWAAMQTPEVVNASINAAHVLSRYRIERVPVLVIGDRYATHPDLVGEDPINLYRVANALISRLIDQERRGAEHQPETKETP